MALLDGEGVREGYRVALDMKLEGGEMLRAVAEERRRGVHKVGL